MDTLKKYILEIVIVVVGILLGIAIGQYFNYKFLGGVIGLGVGLLASSQVPQIRTYITNFSQ